MNVLENKKIYELQTDYVNGTGEHGVVHKKYSELLEQYKSQYAQCPVFSATGLMDLYMGKYDNWKNGIIVDIVLLALSIIGIKGKQIAWFILSFIEPIVKGLQESIDEVPEIDNYKQPNPYRWFAMPFVVIALIFITLFPTVSINWIWVAYSAPLAIDLSKCVYAWYIAPKRAYARDKKRVLAIRQEEARLEEVREQLRCLLPQLQEEYREELRCAMNGMTDSKIQSVMRQYGSLPELFWWEINPSQLLEEHMAQKSLYKQFIESHEVAAIKRTSEKAYKNAVGHYAPMFAQSLTGDEAENIYQKNMQIVKRHGGIILDFLDCIQDMGVEDSYEFVKDYDYAENSFSRAYKTDEWNELGRDIREAHQNGMLTDGDYKSLQYRYDDLNSDVRKTINRKVEVGEHVETSHKLGFCTGFEWTGQALLIPDTQVPGGYILLDYRCRPEYEYDNLEKINLPITKVLADYVLGQPDFIAIIQRMLIWRYMQEKGNAPIRGNMQEKNKNIALLLSIISIAMALCFNSPMVLIVGVILGIISRIKGGGKLAIVGIVINILKFLGLMFVYHLFLLMR